MIAFDPFSTQDGAELLEALAEDPTWQPVQELMMYCQDLGANDLNDAVFAAIAVVGHKVCAHEVSEHAEKILLSLPVDAEQSELREEAIKVATLLRKKLWMPGPRKTELDLLTGALTR